MPSHTAFLIESPVFSQFFEDLAALVEVAVHFLEGVGVHAEDSQDIVEDGVIEAAQVGEVEREAEAVVAGEEDGGDAAALSGVDLSALDGPQAQALMLQLAKYPEMLSAAAADEAPHDVTFYLRDLAASYHSYYDAERILVDDEAVKLARLALVAATAQVLHNGLAVLGVSAPRRM